MSALKRKISNMSRRVQTPNFEHKIELKYCPEKIAFAYPSWKKWTIISAIFVIQCSMNAHASLYGNAVSGLIKQFSISSQAARIGPCVSSWPTASVMNYKHLGPGEFGR